MSNEKRENGGQLLSEQTLRLLIDSLGTKLVLPENVRNELLRFLTVALLDGELRRQHLNRVAVVTKATASLIQQPDESAAEMPIKRVLHDGPGALSDHQLGLLTIDRTRLNALAQLIEESMDEGELGSPWWQAIEELGKKAYQEDKLVELVPMSGSSGPKETTRPSLFGNAAVWLALAASLLIGVVLGSLLIGKGGGGRTNDLVAANATISNVQARGNAVALEMEAKSQRPSFVSFILVGSKKPMVYPDYGENLLQTDGIAAVRYGPVEAEPGFLMLTIITETPAMEILRKAASKGELSSRDPESLKKTISELLWKANYHWVAFHSATVPPAK